VGNRNAAPRKNKKQQATEFSDSCGKLRVLCCGCFGCGVGGSGLFVAKKADATASAFYVYSSCSV
jgi:hypothetical protein